MASNLFTRHILAATTKTFPAPLRLIHMDTWKLTASRSLRTSPEGLVSDIKALPPCYSPFPTTAGVLLGRDGYDVFVVNLNAACTGLIYSAVFGGSHDDIAFAVSVDALGNAYVAGSTSSLDFPTTPHA